MNVLSQIASNRKASALEAARGLEGNASWHDQFSHSAYIFAGGFPGSLTEGDLLAVFSQYGEVVDVHLVRDKETGLSRGFAFLAYEDQRSTVLAVDNLSGTKLGGRSLRVEHVDSYRIAVAEAEGKEASPGAKKEAEEERERAKEKRRSGSDKGGVGDVGFEEDAATTAAAKEKRISSEEAFVARAEAAGASFVPESEVNAAAAGRSGRGAVAAGGDEPWASSNSLFNLLRGSGTAPPPPTLHGDSRGKRKEYPSRAGMTSSDDDDGDRGRRRRERKKKDKKEKKEKDKKEKEKKDKKEKHSRRHRHRKRSRSRSRSSRERSDDQGSPRSSRSRSRSRDDEPRRQRPRRRSGSDCRSASREQSPRRR